MKLKNGVSLIRIYIRRSLGSEPILKDVNLNSATIIDPPTSSEPIDIIPSIMLASNETPSNCFSNSIGDPLSTSDNRHNDPLTREKPADSSEETGFDTDRAEDLPSPNKTEASSISSSVSIDKYTSFDKVIIFHFVLMCFSPCRSLHLVFGR